MSYCEFYRDTSGARHPRCPSCHTNRISCDSDFDVCMECKGREYRDRLSEADLKLCTYKWCRNRFMDGFFTCDHKHKDCSACGTLLDCNDERCVDGKCRACCQQSYKRECPGCHHVFGPSEAYGCAFHPSQAMVECLVDEYIPFTGRKTGRKIPCRVCKRQGFNCSKHQERWEGVPLEWRSKTCSNVCSLCCPEAPRKCPCMRCGRLLVKKNMSRECGRCSRV